MNSKSIFNGVFISFLFIIISSHCGLTQSPTIQKLQDQIKSKMIRFKLTEVDEIKTILGKPTKEKVTKDGGYSLLKHEYPQVKIVYGKPHTSDTPYCILQLSINEKDIDVGANSILTLRTNDDLRKIDTFWGFQSISLKNLDLTKHESIINSMTFDTLTQWPENNKLPAGFDPQQVLIEGKQRGLGLQLLHDQGICGKEVGIAIIDQPLLLGHEEYTSSIVRYDATGMENISPKMHGSPIASIAVGKTLGVAPKAALTYFAVPMWQKSNKPYISSIEKIIDLNKSLPENQKIRVISISTGMFSQYPEYEKLLTVMKKAEGSGIFIITCGRIFMKFSILKRIIGKNPDKASSYQSVNWAEEGDQIRVPGGNRVIASHRGNNVYIFDRNGGNSWGTPFIAGLAALAYQVNKEIRPKTIVELLIKSAYQNEAGPVANPVGFIELVKKYK